MRPYPVPQPQVDKHLVEDVGQRHGRWFRNRIYSKTMLNTFEYCGHKGEIVYINREPWLKGFNLIEGSAGHAVLENYHRATQAGQSYPDGQALADWDGMVEGRRDDCEIESIDGFNALRDEARTRFLDLFAQYRTDWIEWWPFIKGIETPFGDWMEGQPKVEMGGQTVGGHRDLDAETPTDELIVIDYKFVGASSSYRGKKPVPFDLGMEMYRAASRAKRTYFLPLVARGLKKVKIDPPREIIHNEGTSQLAEQLIYETVEDIDRGRFRGPPQVGQGLCNPRWCFFFGKSQCKYTRHLKREDFL